MKRFFKVAGILLVGLIVFAIFSGAAHMAHLFGFSVESDKPSEKSILVLDLTGVIMDGKKFLRDLSKYRDEDHIKGILVRIDSPGGVVGPSQEIYTELKRAHEEFKKPVVAVCGGLCASGGYYASLGANKVLANPGALVGSIGVIMEFANLEGLYSWAKVRRYSLNTGKYKDTGADYREMRPDEKEYIEVTLKEVLGQFKEAIVAARQLPPEQVDAIADGRIFTGAKAAELKMIDGTGTYTDALKMIGEMTGLGNDPETFEPPRPHSWMELVQGGGEEAEGKSMIDAARNALGADFLGRPLFLMPSARWW